MENLRSKLGDHELRSWGDFFNTKRFKLPKPDTAAMRMQTNVIYYRVNYAILVTVILSASL